MRNLEIKIIIDMESPEEMAAAIALLQSINSKTAGILPKGKVEALGVEFEDVSEQVAEEKKTKKKPAAKKEPEAEKPEPGKPAPKKKPAAKKPAEETQEEGPEPTVTLEMIKTVLTSKVKEHRGAMKAKLAELGVANVSNLPAEELDGFYEFLQEL